MKYFLVILVAAFIIRCDSGEVIQVEPISQTSETQTDSFSVRNAEIKQDLLSKLVENDIQHWINDDGSIAYQLSDAEQIDAIFYRVVGEYAARN